MRMIDWIRWVRRTPLVFEGDSHICNWNHDFGLFYKNQVVCMGGSYDDLCNFVAGSPLMGWERMVLHEEGGKNYQQYRSNYPERMDAPVELTIQEGVIPEAFGTKELEEILARDFHVTVRPNCVTKINAQFYHTLIDTIGRLHDYALLHDVPMMGPDWKPRDKNPIQQCLMIPSRALGGKEYPLTPKST